MPQVQYYATPAYGQQPMQPPGVYTQPYNGGIPMGQPMSPHAGQPVYVMNGNGQPVPMGMAGGAIPGGVIAIPVQMALPAGPKQSSIWLDGLCDICNSPCRFFLCAIIFPV
jgi:hypothetical protein